MYNKLCGKPIEHNKTCIIISENDSKIIKNPNYRLSNQLNLNISELLLRFLVEF